MFALSLASASAIVLLIAVILYAAKATKVNKALVWTVVILGGILSIGAIVTGTWKPRVSLVLTALVTVVLIVLCVLWIAKV